MDGFFIFICLIIAFLAGVGFRELIDGVTTKIKKKQSLADKEEYFKVFDEKCKRMNNLTDIIFSKWIELETDIKREKRKSSCDLKIVN